MKAIRYKNGTSRVLTYNHKGFVTSEKDLTGCISEVNYGANIEVSKEHYWTFKQKLCDGVVEERFVIEYNFRPRKLNQGHFVRIWRVPPEYRPDLKLPSSYNEQAFNQRDMPSGRKRDVRSVMPALQFDDPLPSAMQDN